MYAQDYDDYVFPEPWWDLRGHDTQATRQREAMAREFATELGPRHPLSASNIEPIAMFTRQDEVLFRIDGKFLIAHLTWAGRPDPFLRLRPLPDWTATVAEIQDMSENW
ncbi:MAG: hypothetical protein M3Y17_11295 [Actinomycetota bacterium]|nr:hypothetical protein [Actinomycetota bacterium]